MGVTTEVIKTQSPNPPEGSVPVEARAPSRSVKISLGDASGFDGVLKSGNRSRAVMQ